MTLHILINGQLALTVPFYCDERWIQSTARAIDEDLPMLRSRGPVAIYVREDDSNVCRLIWGEP